MLWRALKHIQRGFYIDVGVGCPEKASVTKAFYDRGWQGVNLEPDPRLNQRIIDSRPRDINLKLALTDQSGEQEFYVSDNANLSSLNHDVAALSEASGDTITVEYVAVSTLSEIWQRHVGARDVHFLRLDVPGTERQVLSGNNWSQNRPWILIVNAIIPGGQLESHHHWESLVLDSNYHLAYRDGVNRYYVAAERLNLLCALCFPPNSFDGFISASQIAAETQARAAEIQAQLAATNSYAADLRAQAAERGASASDARARSAEENAEAKEARAQAAEARVQAAEARAQAAEALLYQTQLQLTKAISFARAAQTRSGVLKARNAKIKNSLSWKVTRPIRKVVRLGQKLTGYLKSPQ